jgi:hypothetical protein
MMLRTPVCSYPIIVTHLSFNFLCLMLLYSIHLNGFPPATKAGGTHSPGGEGDGGVNILEDERNRIALLQ